MEQKYTQEELKSFFYHDMNGNEKEKLNDLNVNNEIESLVSSNYQIKFIDKVGYIFISEGHLIMEDGSEPKCYFLKHIFDNENDAKDEIINENSKN